MRALNRFSQQLTSIIYDAHVELFECWDVLSRLPYKSSQVLGLPFTASV